MNAKIIGLISVGIFLGISTPAKADIYLNCNAYAGSAVNQNKENKQRGCGFSGPAWSADYNGHLNWCKSAHVKMADLTREDNGRKQALQQCREKQNANYNAHRKKEKECLAYAKKAIKLDAEITQHCASSNAWPQQLKAHVTWCINNGTGNASHKNSLRVAEINQCKRENKDKVSKKFAHSGVYSKELRRHLPLDHCNRKSTGNKGKDQLFGFQCGKSVADKFCNIKGYVKAIKYPTKGYNNGSNMDGDRPSTWWLEDGKVCHGNCRGFSSITCQGKL